MVGRVSFLCVCVCVFVVRHRLCVSLSVCLTVGGYACVAAHRYVWVAFVLSVSVGHRCERRWINNRDRRTTALGIQIPKKV